MWHFTGKGDEGKANLFGDRRLEKNAPEFELIGTLDEVTALIGLAISFSSDEVVSHDLRSLQDDLSRLMGVVAGAGASVMAAGFELDKRLAWLEERIESYGKDLDNPQKFIFAGSSSLGAAVDIARTVARRAERVYTQFSQNHKGWPGMAAFLNRLSSFLYILRLYVDNSRKYSA